MTTAFQSVIKNIKQVTSKFSKTLTLHLAYAFTVFLQES